MLVALAVVHAACGHRDASVSVAVHSREAIPQGVTHGGAITAVAVTDDGAAALSVDDLGDVRLWPSLDGKRPPVPVAAAGIEQVALGRAGDDFLAAFLSEAGDVLLLEVRRDGVVRRRSQVPGDAPCEQVIAIDNGVLVVRADQSIERYDATAGRRGRIVAGPGESIGAIAARRGGAVALVADKTTGKRFAKQLELEDGLDWGHSTEITADVSVRTLALSRDHHFIAVVRHTTVQVIELATGDQVGDDMTIDTENVEIGFTDDAHLAVLSSDIQWWPADELHSQNRAAVGISGKAIGDGVAVGGLGASLVIATGKNKIRYLGWSRSSLGSLAVVDSHVMLVDHDTVAWLDDRLAIAKTREVSGSDHTLWLDPEHVVRYGPQRANLVDVDHPEPPVHITDVTPTSVFYDPALHLLGLDTGSGRFERYAVDLEHLAVTKLPALDVSPEFSTLGGGTVDLLDPARSDGVIAVVRWSNPARIATYRQARTDTTLIGPSREVVVAEVLAVDAAGTIYLRKTANGPVFRRRGDSEAELAGIDAKALVASHDGALLAALGKNELAIYDATGTKRWGREILAPSQAVFTGDDDAVVVQSAGGLVSFDVTTGAPIAQACSFGFGLHGDAPETTPLHAEPVCGVPEY